MEKGMEKGKVITLMTRTTMRSLIEQARELGIQKEDIVSIQQLGGQIYLIYYK